jgi:hypothetical protein
MRNWKGLLIFSIIILIFSLSFSPIISSKINTKNEIYQTHFENKSQMINVEIIQISNDLKLNSNFLDIPMEEIIILENNFMKNLRKAKYSNDLSGLYFNFLKKYNIVDNNISQYNYFSSYINENNIPSLNTISDDTISNLLCKLTFFLIGIGATIGTHSFSGTIGADGFGVFLGIGNINSDGLMGEQNLNLGFHLGITIGFAGFLIKWISPFIYAPIIFGFGISGYTLWF